MKVLLNMNTDIGGQPPRNNFNAELEAGKGKKIITYVTQVLGLEKPATVNEMNYSFSLHQEL